MGVDRVETSALVLFERHPYIACGLSSRRTDLNADIGPQGANKTVENVPRVAQARVKLNPRCPKMHQDYLKLFVEFADGGFRRRPFVIERLPHESGQLF